MYDLNNDNASLERYNQMLATAEENRRARQLEANQTHRNLMTQVRTTLLKTLSAIIG